MWWGSGSWASFLSSPSFFLSFPFSDIHHPPIPSNTPTTKRHLRRRLVALPQRVRRRRHRRQGRRQLRPPDAGKQPERRAARLIFLSVPTFFIPKTPTPLFFAPHWSGVAGGGCSSAIRVESTDRSIDGGVVCCGVLCLDCRREKKRTNGMSLCVLGKGRADCVRPHEIDWCVRCDVSG